MSRGGLKLEGALEDFGIDPDGQDLPGRGLFDRRFHRLPAATRRGARLCRGRHDQPAGLETAAGRARGPSRGERAISGGESAREPPSLVTVDVSFISVAKVLPRLVAVAAPGAEFLILVKPQFELERGDVGRGGIVRDAPLHERAIERVRAAAARRGWRCTA